MEAAVASELPSCSYFDEDSGLWDSTGLALDSVTVLSGEDAEGTAVDVHVSCISFHLSDFSVTTTDVEAVFQPVTIVRARISFLAFGGGYNLAFSPESVSAAIGVVPVCLCVFCV